MKLATATAFISTAGFTTAFTPLQWFSGVQRATKLKEASTTNEIFSSLTKQARNEVSAAEHNQQSRKQADFQDMTSSFQSTMTGVSAGVYDDTQQAQQQLQQKAQREAFFDPLGLADSAPWGFTRDQTIGWLKHSEIKHGRVAMAAFVGYIIQSNFNFPWAMRWDGTPFPSVDLSPPEQWDVLPISMKVQILLFIGFLEYWSEIVPSYETPLVGQKHYTNGGQPGKYPSFQGLPHPVPFNLYDPFGWYKDMTSEQKESGLEKELSNGRLAMIGIMAIFCEQKIEGAVPFLSGVVKPYAGEVMAPFEGNFLFLQ